MKPARQLLPLFTLASGHTPQLSLFRYQGQQPGPTVHIQAALHASEVQGVAVIHQLAAYLNGLDAAQMHGTLVLLPVANPYALDVKVGEHTPGPFSLEDGTNWNRRFRRLVGSEGRADDGLLDANAWLAEHVPEDDAALVADYRAALLATHRRFCSQPVPLGQRLADVLFEHFLQCDVVLDLHTSTDGTDFFYGPHSMDLPEVGGLLGLKYGLRLSEQFGAASDEAYNHAWAPLLSRLADSDLLPCAFTLEYGGQERVDLIAAERQAQSILNYLRVINVLHDRAHVVQSQADVVWDHQYTAVVAPVGGLCAWQVAPGAMVSKGDLIAQVLVVCGDPSTVSRLVPVIAPFDGVVLNRYPSAVVHEGTPLLKMIPLTRLNAEERLS